MRCTRVGGLVPVAKLRILNNEERNRGAGWIPRFVGEICVPGPGPLAVSVAIVLSGVNLRSTHKIRGGSEIFSVG